MSNNTQDWIKNLLADVDRTIRIPSDVPADDPQQIYNTIVRANPALIQVSDHAPQPVLDLVPKLQDAGLAVIVETDLLMKGLGNSK